MRLGKKERQALRLEIAKRAAIAIRADRVQDHGGKYATAWSRMDGCVMPVSNQRIDWSYRGRNVKRISKV
jgi:hypothetical protein